MIQAVKTLQLAIAAATFAFAAVPADAGTVYAHGPRGGVVAHTPNYRRPVGHACCYHPAAPAVAGAAVGVAVGAAAASRPPPPVYVVPPPSVYAAPPPPP